MCNNSLRPSRFFLKYSIDKAERTIRRKGGTVSSGKVIAEQSLGFWTSLFEPHHYRLIGGVVYPSEEPMFSFVVLPCISASYLAGVGIGFCA